ncbi:hypothetical protein BOTBODRAFT_172816 [Botryobasidium botryosum FD-172 SS1]|uniref:C2H2-type domain-containing protein n=1 Tax=Botryobasidium botryosum (strain FD-172 SS1) TaxID=930990 RepID=A0A067MMC4_BOTB1|nr:hypothetical protein BOTBODRAFT_172816 [Botryobasidium botryosum FD-172 SS1]
MHEGFEFSFTPPHAAVFLRRNSYTPAAPEYDPKLARPLGECRSDEYVDMASIIDLSQCDDSTAPAEPFNFDSIYSDPLFFSADAAEPEPCFGEVPQHISVADLPGGYSPIIIPLDEPPTPQPQPLTLATLDERQQALGVGADSGDESNTSSRTWVSSPAPSFSGSIDSDDQDDAPYHPSRRQLPRGGKFLPGMATAYVRDDLRKRKREDDDEETIVGDGAEDGSDTYMSDSGSEYLSSTPPTPPPAKPAKRTKVAHRRSSNNESSNTTGGPAKIVCSTCKDKFTRPGDLKRHVRTCHGGPEGRVPCTGCNKTFSRSDALVRHQRDAKCS